MIEVFPALREAFNFPAGINKDTAVDTICVDTAELGLVYTRPDTLEGLIRTWCNRRANVWMELEATLHYDYNPIHNYDRTEEHSHTETRDLTNTEKRVGTETEDTDATVENTENMTGDSGQTDGKVAYNSGSIVTTATTKNNATQDTTSRGASAEKRAKDVTDDITKKDTGTVINTEKIVAYGNIGVTSTQDMIRQQREIVEFDIYHYISDDFKKEFCIMLY